MKASAIIVAAGSGTRLGRSEPKAFVPLAGRTLLSYSLATLARVDAIGEIVIAVPAGVEAVARLETGALPIPVKIIEGGIERQDSVRIALAITSALSELVVVHDAARPFATVELFQACLAAAEKSGGAIAAIPLSDTLKRVGADGTILATVPRAGLWQAQTPQAFRRAALVAAHDRAIEKGASATDDADLVEQIGARVEVVQCSTQNPKITTQSDLAQAEALLLSLARDRERLDEGP
jgi:2-C-methyl-D-erythritol 4-phosphate cytidylyltransferase